MIDLTYDENYLDKAGDIMDVNYYTSDSKPELDFLNDTPMEHLMKWSKIAHGNRAIEGLWEASIPNVINPINEADIVEWGDEAMSFEHRLSKGTYSERTGVLISARTNYDHDTKLAPFYGYKSEAPMSKIFKEDEPIGPAAKAVKAAGVIAAACESNDEDDSWIWDILKKVWQIDVSHIKSYLKPDSTLTSRRDLNKLTRNMSHALYGFNMENPKVFINMGMYKPDFMKDNVYIDWHKIAIGLRWIGESIMNYNEIAAKDIGQFKMYFSLYHRNFSPVWDIPLKPKNIPEFTQNTSYTLAKIAKTTMDLFNATMENINLQRYFGLTILDKTTLREFTSGDIQVFKHAFQADTVHPIYPKLDISRAIQQSISQDIFDTKLIKEKKPKVQHISATYEMSVERAIKMSLASFMYANLKSESARRLQDISEYDRFSAKFTDNTVQKWKALTLVALPHDLSHCAFLMLKMGSASEITVREKIVRFMCKHMKSIDHIKPNFFHNFFHLAVELTNNVESLANLIHSGIMEGSRTIQGTKSLKFVSLVNNSAIYPLLSAINDYLEIKSAYWSEHYDLRARQAADYLKLSKNSEDFSVQEQRHWAKIDNITYNYLAKIYKNVRYRVKDDFYISYHVPQEYYIKLVAGMLYNFLRKRINDEKPKWYNEDKDITINAVGKLLIKSSIRDINHFADKTPNLVIKHSKLWNIVTEKLSTTAAAATSGLKKRMYNPANMLELNDEDDKPVEDLKKDFEPEFNDFLVQDYLDHLSNVNNQEEIIEQTSASVAMVDNPEMTEQHIMEDEPITTMDHMDMYEEEEVLVDKKPAVSFSLANLFSSMGEEVEVVMGEKTFDLFELLGEKYFLMTRDNELETITGMSTIELQTFEYDGDYQTMMKIAADHHEKIVAFRKSGKVVAKEGVKDDDEEVYTEFM